MFQPPRIHEWIHTRVCHHKNKLDVSYPVNKLTAASIAKVNDVDTYTRRHVAR